MRLVADRVLFNKRASKEHLLQTAIPQQVLLDSNELGDLNMQVSCALARDVTRAARARAPAPARASSHASARARPNFLIMRSYSCKTA